MSRSLFIKAYSEDIEMKKVLKAEMWDKMQYLFRNYYDRMMHCALFYNGTIDADVLTRVLHFQLDNVPVLHSRYHNNPVKPYWVVQDYKTDDFLTVRASDDLDRDIMAFVTQRIPITDNVQIKVGLFTKDGKSAIAFVVNHMCFDGGDLKYFVTKLCENYTKLLAGDENLEIKHGTRSYDAVYSAMSEEDKKTAKSLYRNISAVKDEHFFPLTEKREGDVNRIVRRKLSAERFNAARLAGKAMGFTVNDIILAAYVRSLYEFGVCKDDERLTIPCMVDLRRHLAKGGLETGLTNHTGFMPVTIDGNGKDMRDMLDKVAKAMEKNKHDKFLGLYSLPLLHLAYAVFPHCISEQAIKLGYDNPLIGMSNIGSIKPSDYRMGDAVPEDGFYTGAVKGKPFMQLALTTFEGEVTFTIAITGNEEDEKIVNEFFDILLDNIDKIARIGQK